MLKRIRMLALSVFFLLYTEGLLQAHTHYSFEGVNDFAPTTGLLYSDIPQPLSAPAAATPPPPKQARTAKNSAEPATHLRRSAKDTGRKPKKSATSSRLVKNSYALNLLRKDYRNLTGRELLFTSTGRTERGQAAAMFRNFANYGSAKVVASYRNKRAARAIAKAYEANRRRPRRAIAAMTAVITRQVRDGVFVSNHLRGKAADLRSWGPQRARIKPLRQIARLRGWRVLVEQSHIHVELS
jgi:hypothetical protein